MAAVNVPLALTQPEPLRVEDAAGNESTLTPGKPALFALSVPHLKLKSVERAYDRFTKVR